MDYQRIINKRIYELCAEHDMSITKLAIAANVRPSTLHSAMLSKPNRHPKLEIIHRIAFVFEMTLAEFFDFPEMEQLIVDYFYQLDAPTKR